MPLLTIAGKVASSIETQTGKGIIKVWEKSDFKGQEKFVLWTCWFDQPQKHVVENDEIMIDGRLSTKVGTYTAKTGEEKTAVEHHINDAVIKQHKSSVVQDAFPSLADEAPF